jgi:sugar lactone lactonase YvrE
MAFDADCRSFYHPDSFAYEIHVFDCDRPVTFEIKSCLLDLLKLMACQMD